MASFVLSWKYDFLTCDLRLAGAVRPHDRGQLAISDDPRPPAAQPGHCCRILRRLSLLHSRQTLQTVRARGTVAADAARGAWASWPRRRICLVHARTGTGSCLGGYTPVNHALRISPCRCCNTPLLARFVTLFHTESTVKIYDYFTSKLGLALVYRLPPLQILTWFAL